jgi:signal transduction histidine kinase
MADIPAPIDPRRRALDAGAAMLLALWCIIPWCSLVFWQVFEHEQAVHSHRDSLEREGQAYLNMLDAALRSMGPRRREVPEFLNGTLNEAMRVANVRGALLVGTDGVIVASAGSATKEATPESLAPTRWTKTDLVIGRRIDIGGPPMGRGPGARAPAFGPGSGGRGRAALEDLPDAKPADLYLFLDRTETDRRISGDLVLRAGILATAAAAFAGVFLFVHSGRRTRQLRGELALAETRAVQHREWALLGAGLAHETKNPISVVRGLAQQLADDSAAAARHRESAHRMVEEIDRVVARIDEFLQFSRPIEPALVTVPVHALFNDMAALIEADLAPREGEVAIDAEPLAILADVGMLRQILLNLLVNAAQAIGPRGHIRMRTFLADDGAATIEVVDDGKGIPPEELGKIFQPYYSLRPGGTGLGLAIVRRLAEAHGWRAAVESTRDAGTTVRITGIRTVTTA